jgi:Cys-rich four helix bundle protein (predicted Tat secretion target)
MDRRKFIAAAGTVAAAASASQAFAQIAEEPMMQMAEEPMMHPPKYKALEEATAHCVATGNDCLRHCLGMYSMKDTSMAGCANTAFQLVAACAALQTLAAVNSEHTGRFANHALPNAKPAANRVRPAPRNAVRLLPSIWSWSLSSPKTAPAPEGPDVGMREWSVCSQRKPPLFAFAGSWRLWTGERKGETGEHQLFAFLTTESNDVVRPIHSKAMPVLLTKAEEWDTWLGGSVNEAMALQKPLPNNALRIVATGEKRDRALVVE